MSFIAIKPEEITENPFKLIGKDWALVTAGDKKKLNTMTISWGGVGIMWGKPVAFTFIRPQRYTMEFLQKQNYYTMAFFDEQYRAALNFCGTKSGRDHDKIKETNLTTLFTDEGVPYFEEAKLVFVCKKMYAQKLNSESIILKPDIEKWYNNDYHTMFISEITNVFIKK